MTQPLVTQLREELNTGRARLLKIQSPSKLGRNWLIDHTRLLDDVLKRIFHAAWETARAAHGESNRDRTHPDHEAGLALLAIGGYGRGELCPHSDIDLAFVTAEEENPMLDAAVKEAFRLIVETLIDGAKLDVSYAYRPLADCERLAHSDKTALLDARLVAGSDWLVQRLHDELRRTWDGVEFLLDKARERREVARQVQYSQYAVEPNLKEGAGALRDIQSALWVAGAMMRTSQPLRDLEWRGLVTARDCESAVAARDFFLQLRVWLHLQSGKKNDVLRVEMQDRCARSFGYNGSGPRASQTLLNDYYRHAENVAAFSEKVLRRLLDGPLRLDDHFVASHQRMLSAHPYTLQNHPELLIAPFAQARKYGFDVSPELERAVEDALPLVNEETRAHPIARAGFWSLLSHPESAADALTQLRASGVLQAFVPEFGATLRLAPGDPSHELTVGEHSIYAVRKLGELWSERDNNDETFGIWSGIDDVPVLVLATLLHDVGKTDADSDHSVSGARIAEKIGARLGLSHDRCNRLALLVRRHLLLPRAARLRDLSAPGTIREIIKHAGDVAMLKMLYLLSVADASAVGERAHSKLDAEAMRELYERVLVAMTREETSEVLTDNEKREQLVQRERQRQRRELRHLEFDDAILSHLYERLPASYILNTPLPTIATHLKFLEQLPDEQLIVDFYSDARAAFTEMTIVTYDDARPGLLSKICGVVHAIDAEILAAHVYTIRAPDSSDAGDGQSTLPVGDTQSTLRASATQSTLSAGDAASSLQPPASSSREIVLDRLHLLHRGRALPEARSARLAVALREVLLGEKSVEDVLRAAGKEASTGIAPQRIGARNDLSDEHTVISVVNDNVPGLLFFVTRALAAIGLDIHTAKITTWAGRAEDAFYVTRRGEDSDSDARDEKIGDDDIKNVLEELRRKLLKP